MAVTDNATEVLTDIADAIREKDSIPGPIPVSNFAARIQALPTAPPSGWPNNRRVYRFPNYLTTEQQIGMQLVRLDGAPAYEALNAEIYNMFKGSALINLVGQLRDLPSRTYDAPFLVGNKLYLGSSTASMTLPILDTLTGRITEIVGLPSRAYNLFTMVNSKIYCLHGSSSPPSINSVVCIDTTDDSFKLIPVSSFGYQQITAAGNWIFLGARNSVLTYVTAINTVTDTARTVSGLSSGTHGSMFAVGHKVYVGGGHGSGSYSTINVIDTTKIDPWDSPVKQLAVQSGLYVASVFVQNRFLYLASQYANTHIVRIDTNDDSVSSIGPLPSRSYAVENSLAIWGPDRFWAPFQLVGNRVYAGAGVAATSIIVINHTAGTFLRQIESLPSRIYTGFQLIGTDKLYVQCNTQASTLVVIDPTVDTFTEITGLPSRAYNRFFLNGTILYLLSLQSAATSITLLNTTDDSFTQLPPAAPLLASRNHGVPLVVEGDAEDARRKLYLGTGVIIDLGTNSLIQEMLDWSTTRMVYANDKIYVIPPVLSKSVLPYQALPTYIKYGS